MPAPAMTDMSMGASCLEQVKCNKPFKEYTIIGKLPNHYNIKSMRQTERDNRSSLTIQSLIINLTNTAAIINVLCRHYKSMQNTCILVFK